MICRPWLRYADRLCVSSQTSNAKRLLSSEYPWNSVAKTDVNERKLVDSSSFRGIAELLELSLPLTKAHLVPSQKTNLCNPSFKKTHTNMLTMQRDLLRKRRMKVKEMNPSQYTFLMRQWVQKSGAEVGRPMLEQMIKMGVDPIEVYTIMIKQSIEQAKACSTTEVFEDQGGSEKHVMKALNHLHVMRLKGLTPRSDTYAPIVSWLAESDLLAEIQELLKWIKQDNADACFIDMFKCLGEGGQQDKIKRCFLLLKDFGTF